ncbi:MAG: response regulator transcription factor [Bacteroidales bacterium]|jgi:DNA-binding NarL/FixJ family response regulator|nr:response regulator transcription factor [Bacteroidales bacterium]
MSNNNFYRIVIVEPSPIVFIGLSSLLQTNGEFSIAGHMENLAHFKERLRAFHPDILIINPIVIDFDKQFSLRSLFQETPNVVLIALVYNYFDNNILRQYNGIIEICDKSGTIENTLRNALFSPIEKKETVDNGDLTDREIDVLVAVAKGWMNKEIADKLNISIHTVISHRKNITRKTGIKSVSGLTVYALINNLINSNEV